MQLREAETLGVLDDHQRRVRHIHADLDDRRRDENVRLPGGEGGHAGVLVLGLHAAVDAGDAVLRKRPLQHLRVLLGGFELGGDIVRVFDLRADDKYLTPLTDELVDEGVEPRAVALVHAHGLHRLPSGRQLVDDRHVQIPVHQQRQCARNGRCAHDECVRLLALAHERGALLDAEAVLLVRDDETETEKRHRVADERVRADDHVELSAGECLLYLALLPDGHRARQPSDTDAKRLKQRAQRVLVLLGEDLGRRHEGTLAVVFVRKPDARRGDERLAGADVALHKAAHRHAGDHVLHGGGDGAPLRPGG